MLAGRVGILIIFLAAFVSAQQSFVYSVSYSTESPGRLKVSISAAQPVKAPAAFVIPRAIPSGYGLQLYDRFVMNVRAFSPSGQAVAVVRAEDGPRWNVADAENGVSKVVYEVDLDRLESEVLSAADQSIARPLYTGLLGYSVFGYIEGHEDSPVKLNVNGPKEWPVFTTLAPKYLPDKGNSVASAADFYELADSQVMMGPDIEIFRLDTKPASFIALYSETETNFSQHSTVFASAFEKVVNYFGDAPFDFYTAHIQILKPKSERHSYGFSMEHSKSGTFYLGLDRAYTKDTPEAEFVRDELNFIHHIAHSWIPKKVYGTGYLPFTWELPPLIDTVWFNEGFARFAMIEIRADSMPAEDGKAWREGYLASLREYVESQPTFVRNMPLIELSRIGSVMYSEDFRTGRTLFSKGALMADEMDRLIRERTNGKKRLRDSLRAMVRWGVENKRPFTLEELPGLIAKPVGLNENDIRAVMEKWLARGAGTGR